MSRYVDMEWHAAACLFPMMGDAELRELAADIKATGLRKKIELLGGKILDGRNRHRACQLAGVEPQFEYVTSAEIGDPFAYVWSLNGPRRHLTESQRAMVGAKLREHFAAQAKARQGARNDLKNLPANLREGQREASEEAAALVNVSARSIDSAARVIERGAPELVGAVERGDVSVSAAAQVAKLPPAQQASVVAAGPAAVVAAAKELRAPVPAKPAVDDDDVPQSQLAPLVIEPDAPSPREQSPDLTHAGGNLDELALATRFAADAMAFVGAARARLAALRDLREPRNLTTRDNAITHLVLLADELRDLLPTDAKPALRVVR